MCDGCMTDKELNKAIIHLQDMVEASGKMGESLNELQTRVNDIKKHMILLSVPMSSTSTTDIKRGTVVARKKEIDETLIKWIEDNKI